MRPRRLRKPRGEPILAISLSIAWALIGALILIVAATASLRATSSADTRATATFVIDDLATCDPPLDQPDEFARGHFTAHGNGASTAVHILNVNVFDLADCVKSRIDSV